MEFCDLQSEILWNFVIKLYLFLENREKNKKKNYGIRQITELKISSRTVNSAKENCGNPQKFYIELIKVFFLQKKNAEIRKNFSCYDCKYRD